MGFSHQSGEGFAQKAGIDPKAADGYNDGDRCRQAIEQGIKHY
jgi:hypothetical protein